MHRLRALETLPFSNILSLQFTAARTLIQQSHKVRQLAEVLKRALGEDVRVGTVFYDVLPSHQDLKKTTHREKGETDHFGAAASLPLVGFQGSRVVSPWSTVRRGEESFNSNEQKSSQDKQLILKSSYVPPVSVVQRWQMRDLSCVPRHSVQTIHCTIPSLCVQHRK